MSSRIIVANWKMQLPFASALAFIHQQVDELDILASKNGHRIVICPSFEALYPIGQSIGQNSRIILGAQDCSTYPSGAHTGQVSALSLAQLGCQYCIIGHSERRTEYHETDTLVTAKAVQLLCNGITPIVCIGENAQEMQRKLTYTILEQQLTLVLQEVRPLLTGSQKLIVAYEPIWAIGSGNIPDTGYLQEVFSWLQQYLTSQNCAAPLLYGGSVTEKVLEPLSTIAPLEGFLVGGASVDFQKFKNIVSWYS